MVYSEQDIHSEAPPYTWHSLPSEIKQYLIVYNSLKNVMRLVCKECYEWLGWQNKETLLQKFPDMKFHGYTWEGIMPLLCANNKIDIVKAICTNQQKSKKWINRSDSLGKVLLQYAQSTEIREVLITSGANLETFFNTTTITHEEPLMTAIMLDDIATVKLYLNDTRIAKQINTQRTHNNLTPLLLACIYRRYNIAELLFSDSATSQIIHNNNTILHKVAAYSCDIFMKLLLKNDTQPMINNRNDEGETPLMVAVSSRHSSSDIVKLLLNHGADANMRDKEHKTSAVWLAVCYHKSLETIKALLPKTTPENINHVSTKAHRCMLSIAVIDSNYELATLLINHGAQINTVDGAKDHYTPLKRAIRFCNLSMVEHLLAQATSEITTNSTIIPDMITYTNKLLARTDLTQKEQITLILILNKLRNT